MSSRHLLSFETRQRGRLYGTGCAASRGQRGSRDAQQVVEDVAELDQAEREVALIVIEMWLRAGDVRREPFTVRERHHEILAALPHGDRHGDRGEVEAPRL